MWNVGVRIFRQKVTAWTAETVVAASTSAIFWIKSVQSSVIAASIAPASPYFHQTIAVTPETVVADLTCVTKPCNFTNASAS